MTTLAVGMDLVDIARVERMLARHGQRALQRLLTDEERGYCLAAARPAQHVAARLAAKEAAYKALQQADNARGVGWRDTEVVLNGDGRPTLRFRGKAKEAAERMNASSALVSITHSDASAAAVVILTG